MAWEIALVSDLNGHPKGFLIVKSGTTKIDGQHFYDPDDIELVHARIAELGAEQNILDHWPQLEDPDVQTLLSNPDWEPLELEERDMPIIDPETQKPMEDPSYKGLYGEGPVNDFDVKFLTEKRMVPKYPTEVTSRIKKAQEIIARQRMEE